MRYLLFVLIVFAFGDSFPPGFDPNERFGPCNRTINKGAINFSSVNGGEPGGGVCGMCVVPHLAFAKGDVFRGRWVRVYRGAGTNEDCSEPVAGE